MKCHTFLIFILSLFRPSIGETAWKTLDGTAPLLIAHRGEKVLVPEHTIPAYALAAILGADYVEPDLCLTKDDHLVCHHDLYITDSNTDVGAHSEFDHLKHQSSKGFKWYIQNFTLEELQTIKIFQKNVGVRPKEFNGIFTIPTFQEFLDTIHEMNFKLQRSVGIAPELKDPLYHNANRRPNFMEDTMLEILQRYGYDLKKNIPGKNCTTFNNSTIKCPPVLIQSFQLPPLEYLKTKTSFDLVMLVDDDDSLLTYEGIERVSKIAHHFYIWKEILHVGRPELISANNFTFKKEAIEFLGGFVPFQELPQFVHQHGMKLGIYTIYDSREESHRVKKQKDYEVGFTKKDELFYYFNLGVDGFFVENVAESRELLRQYQSTFCASSGSERGQIMTKSFFLLFSFYLTMKFV